MNGELHWSEAVSDCETRNESYVLVTILGAQGSTPRNSGTKMVVTRDRFNGTIGGGVLEYRALEQATALLIAGEKGQWVEHYPLGEKLGQCCGGATSLLFEAFQAESENVLLFGAGHVGRALAPLLATLPLRLQWIDSRASEFPKRLPSGVITQQPEQPLDLIASAPPDSYFLIMTHEHPLDYALAEAALARNDAAYIGVIGSSSKARRFRLRLAHRGYPPARIDAVQCPIGSPEVPGKRPAEIAVSIAAQLIAHYQARRSEHSAGGTVARAPGWKTLQTTLAAAGVEGITATAPDRSAATPDNLGGFNSTVRETIEGNE